MHRRYRNIRSGLITIASVLLLNSFQSTEAQGNGFLNKLRVGFGAGVNFAHITEAAAYPLYEDLTGVEYKNFYTPFYRNFGHQYFIHLDWHYDFLALALKPGTYTYNFKLESTIGFQSTEVRQTNPYTLRYFEIPLEVKYTFELQSVQPYFGGAFSYGHMLGSSSNSSFIRPKMVLGAMGGAYVDLQYVILDISLGYNYNLNIITNKSNRTDTSRPDAFAQSDIRLNDIRVNVSALFALQKKRSTGKAACNYPRRGPGR